MISPIRMSVNFIFRKEYPTLEKFKEHLGLALKRPKVEAVLCEVQATIRKLFVFLLVPSKVVIRGLLFAPQRLGEPIKLPSCCVFTVKKRKQYWHHVSS